MKLLFLSNFYPPNVFGGYERLCHEVALGLADRGHEITVLTSNYGKFSDENYNHFVSRDLNIFANKDDIYKPFEISLEERNTLNIINSEIINKIISEKTPDVIFIWNLYFYDKPMIEQIQNIKLPKVYLLTDNWLIAELNNKYISHYFDSIIRESTISHQFYFVKFLCNFFNKFKLIKKIEIDGLAIFPSKFMKSLYLNAGFKFSLNSKICHHGVQINNVPHNQYSSRLSFYNTDKINILIAGRIVHIKGIHVAIKAIARLINQKGYKNLSLSIVGDATDKEYFHEINELTLIHGIKDYVFFKPAVKEGELFQLFQEFDIYLFPSLYEPFSLTLILALDSGIPTIASNIGGNIELIQNYKSGLLFESNNVIDLASKIELLVLNNNLRNNISRNGILRSKQFSFKSMLINLEKIIIKFLDEYHLKFKNK